MSLIHKPGDAFESFVAEVQRAWGKPEHRWMYDAFQSIRGNLMDRPMLRTTMAGVTATMLAGAFWAIESIKHSPKMLVQQRSDDELNKMARNYEVILRTLSAENSRLRERVVDLTALGHERSLAFFFAGILAGSLCMLLVLSVIR